jgi:hypothetical protein
VLRGRYRSGAAASSGRHRALILNIDPGAWRALDDYVQPAILTEFIGLGKWADKPVPALKRFFLSPFQHINHSGISRYFNDCPG